MSTLSQQKKRAKFWLVPIEETWNDGFRRSEMKEIERIIRVHINLLLEAWNDFFAGE